MSKWIEIFGVFSLWLVGMTAVATSSWPTWALVLAGVVATCGVVAYAIVAICERRRNNLHYFTMAALSVSLAFISLAVVAFGLDGGPMVVMCIVSGVLFFALAFIGYEKWCRQSSSA